ncbi:MAG: methyltransferase domain-containing protein [Anaerolineae bacterium]|nr:methyltransferase domain-containing protein [Anaerolineae bacterium]MCX8066745.1 methyltransferase domain-containing protein [Anaerolineae bacterium]MDW7990665.1 methyltransferase domain-containing protein [Anaerolineae bacterium]
MEKGGCAEPPSVEPTTFFDEFANGYDQILRFPWYAWLFARLHTLIVHTIIRPYSPQTVLDVGCGTGFQSFLYAAFGARVVGIDVSPRMVRIAREKAVRFPAERVALLTIPALFPFVRPYNQWIQKHLDGTGPEVCVCPIFEIADARRLPFRDRTFEHVNCCGSTLSLVPEYPQALAEMVRVLKPGGTLFLEAEGRWNGDLFWTLADALTGGRRYGMSWKQARGMLCRPFSAPVTVDYPFEHTSLRLTLFTQRGLQQDLQRFGLKILKNWTIHSLTNLIPSPLLHQQDTPAGIRWLFRILAWAEKNVPLALPGCSLVFVAQKAT